MVGFKIGNKEIGNKSPCFIIAEIGINHNGDIDIAKKMIDAAVEAGCDAVKFQTFKAELMYPKTAGTYETDGHVLKIHEAMKRFELPIEWVDKLIQYCKQKKVFFFSSVSDIWSVDVMDQHGMEAFKLTSYDTTNIPLLEHVAKKNKPIIMSTGAAYLSEVEDAIRAIERHNKNLAILHCVTKYPAPLESCNLNVLETLKQNFPNFIIGYSDHTEDPIKAPIAAIVKGAKIIEKHITLDKTMEGPDQRFALNPKQVKEMVKTIRDTEEKLKNKEDVKIDKTVLGSNKKVPTEIEMYTRDFAYRTLFASKDIKVGEPLTKENIAVLRRGQNPPGLEPKYINLVLKHKALRNIKEGATIVLEDFIKI